MFPCDCCSVTCLCWHFTWGIWTCQHRLVRWTSVCALWRSRFVTLGSSPVFPDKCHFSMQTFLLPFPHFDTDTQSQITVEFDTMSDDLLTFSVVEIASVTGDLSWFCYVSFTRVV
jgi:hypothetical protein